MARRITLGTALAILALALSLPAAAAARAKPKTSYYVSLGDSYSQGYQPIGPNQADVVTKQGFTDYLYPQAKKRVPGLKLVKLGCGGATTDSMINGTRRCIEPHPFSSTSKATSQLTYASKFIRKHRGHVALVTVSIGGNDFDSCTGDLTAITSCVTAGIARMKANLPVIARALRSAAGSRTIIVGSTYPDVVLGGWVGGPGLGQQLAQASVAVFQQQVNPAMRSAYGNQKIGFVDATAGFGGYIPFTQTTTLAPFGTIPVSVANICNLAWYCVTRPGGPDLHLRASGYKKMASLYLTEIRKRL
ncbi:MAG: SGNH/GDSL hydrolase family protein [Thermoleophilaceae bacterium]